VNFLLRLLEDFFSLGIGVVPFLSKRAKNFIGCQCRPHCGESMTILTPKGFSERPGSVACLIRRVAASF
jgi:hypothetical protein